MLRGKFGTILLALVSAMLVGSVAFAGALLEIWELPFLAIQIDEFGNWLRVVGEIPAVTLSFKAIGLSITLLTGVIALWRAYRALEWSLPGLLQRFIERQARLLRSDRDLAIATVAKRLGFETISAPSDVEFQLSEIEDERNDRRSELSTLTSRLAVSSRASRNLSFELATAHLIRGSIYSAAARAGLRVDDNRSKAVNELGLAALHDPKDLRIWKAYVSELQSARLLDDLPRAFEGYIQAAQAADLPRESGVARAKLGQYWADRSAEPGIAQGEITRRLRLSRSELEAAVAILRSNPPDGSDPLTDRELATSLERLGQTRVALGTPHLAAQRYAGALEIYRLIEDAAAVQRTKDALDDLDVDLSDDGAGEPEAGATEAMIVAMIELGEAQLFAGETASVHNSAINAQLRLGSLRVPVDITAERLGDLKLRIKGLLERVATQAA